MKKLKNIINLRKTNIYTVLSMVTIVTILLLSVDFYYKIYTLLAIIMLILELSQYLFILEIPKTKGKLKFLLILVCIVATLLSLFGFISNSMNIIENDYTSQFKTINNPEYIKYKEAKKQLQYDKNEAQNELKNYPTLKQYITDIKSPEWESKNKIILQYNTNKQSLQNKLDKIQNKIDKLIEPKEKLKIKVKNTGISNNLIFLENLIGIKSKTLSFIIFIILGLTLQILMYSFRLLLTIKKDLDTPEAKKDLDTPEAKKDLDTPEAKKDLDTPEANDISNIYTKNQVINFKEMSDTFNILKSYENNKSERIKFLNYIKTNNNNGIIPGIKRTHMELNISMRSLQKIINQLKDENILITEKNKTKITNDKELLRNVK